MPVVQLKDEDIRRIVDFIRKQCPSLDDETTAGEGTAKKVESPKIAAAAVMPDSKPVASFDEMLAKGGDDAEDDQLIEMAVQIIRETQRASTSSLQRRLRIGYTRAARIMDVLEERGLVGPARGSDPREILIDLDGEMPNNPAHEKKDE